jgi:hypothetical protein
MNTLLREEFDILHGTQSLRTQIMDLLSNDDLAYRLPGDNVSLGELCREIGEVEQAYLDSFKMFKQDFSYRNSEPGLPGDVDRLKAWFKRLDAELDEALYALSDEDFQGRMIDRGGFQVPPRVQVHIYVQALLIFYGKATLYLRALKKPLPKDVQAWIG